MDAIYVAHAFWVLFSSMVMIITILRVKRLDKHFEALEQAIQEAALEESEDDEPTPFFASEQIPCIRQFNTTPELQQFLIDEQIRGCDIDEIVYLGGQISVIYVKGDA